MDTNPAQYHPLLFWHQDKDKAFITVKLTDVEGPRMQIGNASVAFKARGMGANGLQEYSFQLDLYQPVDDEESDFRVTDTSVNIVLVKRNSAVWPRLTESKDRLPWLRTDFDRLSEDVLKAMFAGDGDDAWESDADADDSSPKTSVNFVRPSAEELRKRNMQRVEEIAREQYNEFLNRELTCYQTKTRGKWARETRKQKHTSINTLHSNVVFLAVIKNPLVFYLLIFNIFQWAGYLYVFGVLVTTWWSEGEGMWFTFAVSKRLNVFFLSSGDSRVQTNATFLERAMKSRAFDLVADRLIVVQVAAFLEIAHVLLGWVKGGILPKIMQEFEALILTNLFAFTRPWQMRAQDSVPQWIESPPISLHQILISHSGISSSCKASLRVQEWYQLRVLRRLKTYHLCVDSKFRLGFEKKGIGSLVVVVTTCAMSLAAVLCLYRYPYYALRLFDEEIGLISYLRYTLWIPLYPLGFMCEGKLIILSMPLLEMSRKFCLDMPNWANVSFDFPIFLHVYVLLMLPGEFTCYQWIQGTGDLKFHAFAISSHNWLMYSSLTGFFILMQHMYLQRRRKMMSTVGTRAGRFKPSPR
ncbi:unnamed protein product [Mesocestoides corti]|uniref:Very-long-chain (3R)-3-hydroxyacyl-CoA dehydratase n=1 Tax=Mesocestoides corti TaxID=53468 RepID=A0A0R3U802_MESCO|nr:unnamed protein product [Mesocestoides corti]